MISLLKSSAGSGKTYNLAKTYIRMILTSPDPRAYRHVLAVTFTNKATEEMKSRILKELDILSCDTPSSPYYGEFRPLFPSDDALRQKATDVLSEILRDYSSFAVSTIDKFFQQALRSFAREIGQFASYQVELDKESLVKESVDRILDSLSEEGAASRSMIDWLSSSALSQLESGSSMKLESGLYSMASNLMSEGHRTLMEQNGRRLQDRNLSFDILYSKEWLSQVRENLTAYRDRFKGRVEAAAGEVLSVLDSKGVDPSDFYKGFLKSVLKYQGMRGDIEPLTDAFVSRALDPSGWFSKKNASLLARVQGPLEGPLGTFVSLFEGDDYKAYCTAQNLLPQLYDLGIARELREQFRMILQEKNVLSIDDSNVLLRRIIAGSDAPFVYEKMGVKFENFLLDEFQDTSQVQWENFVPLLRESDSTGRDNLLVGDVKQSIYRWRDSDWKLFESGVRKVFPAASDKAPLQDNWRSLRTIVKFNNGFFAHSAGILDSRLGGGQDMIKGIYRDVCQEVRTKDSQEGSVRLTFCSPSDELDAVYGAVLSALQRGATYGKIAVVVRTNVKGADVATHLISKGIPVISDESLKVKSSPSVRLIVSLLSLLDNPKDKVGYYQAQKIAVTLPTSWLSLEDLCEQIIRSVWKDGAVPEGEVLYVQSFLDDVVSYARSGGNNLHLFLEHWKEASPSLSSPQGVDAVRIITIHKSKGLEFPYVIIPFLEGIDLYNSKKTRKWVYFSGEGTPLEGKADGLYYLGLSKQSLSTLYAEEYLQELLMQYIDNINNTYVAFTRAEKGLHIIGALPDSLGKVDPSAISEAMLPSIEYHDFCEILYAYACAGVDPSLGRIAIPEEERPVPLVNGTVVEFQRGVMYDFGAASKKEGEEDGKKKASAPSSTPVGTSFRSYPMTGIGFRGEEVGLPEEEQSPSLRLRLSSDAYEFFSQEGPLGTSSRIRGIVLHDILSRMRDPSDLEAALSEVLGEGGFSPRDLEEYRDLLSSSIENATLRIDGRTLSVKEVFFPRGEGYKVICERTFLRPGDLKPLRPDRVVIDLERREAVVVDYKFASPDTAEREKYTWQVRSYCKLVGRTFKVHVRGFLWFIQKGETRVVDVDYGSPHSEEIKEVDNC